MDYVTIDIETKSGTDLTTCGVHRYVEDPEFDILLTGIAVNDEPVKVYDHPELDCFGDLEEFKDTLRDILLDPGIVKVAQNAAFERTCFGRYLGIYCDPASWIDTQVMAASCGLPLSLDAATKALGFTDTAKDARGKALIKLFSCPRKPTKTNPARWVRPQDAPDKWKTYCEYNRQDVVAERALFSTLKRWMPSETEHKFWCLDQQINDRGIRVDTQLCTAAQAIGRGYKARLYDEAVALTGLENPQSVAQVKAWLSEQEGIEVPTLNKKAIADVLTQLTTEQAKKFMALRAELSKSADKKYDAILRSVTQDEHIHGCFQFFGGHTGRFAGRLVQLQNLKRNEMNGLAECRELVKSGDLASVEALYEDVSDTLGQLTRTALIPEPGQRFIVSDFSSIEARIIAWIARQDWRLNTFLEGGDIYCASASQMFGVPVVKHGVNGELRQKGKIAELALG